MKLSLNQRSSLYLDISIYFSKNIQEYLKNTKKKNIKKDLLKNLNN